MALPEIDFQTMIQDFVQFLPNLIAAIVTFAIVLVISGFVRRWVRKLAEGKIQNAETVKLFSRVARWTVLVLGTIIALEQVNFNVTSFVAGLGIAGFTIGFALQDMTRNFVAGILLLIRQPFKIGDTVEISGFTGSVQDIAIRDTSIKTLDGELVILPNADVLSNPIKNFSGMTNRRRMVLIGLGYDEDVDSAKSHFLRAIASVEGVLSDPQPSIIAVELGASALTLEARFWVDQISEDLLKVHSRVVQSISEVATRENIDLPYPTKSIIVETKGQNTEIPKDF